MWNWLKSILASKKVRTLVATAATVGINALSKKYDGPSFSPDEVGLLVGAGSAYMLGQGLADLGKEAKKLP